MKRYFIIYIAVLILFGCSEKYEESLGLFPTLTPRYISVSPNSLSYTSSEETKDLSIASMGTPWKFENGIEWITLSPASGSSSTMVDVKASENTSGDNARTGIFYLKSDLNDWNYEAPIIVSQARAIPSITLSKSEIEFAGKTSSETVTVTANCSWEVISSAEWVSISKEGNIVTLSASSNESNTYRTTAVVIHHSNSVSATITIRQAPASITASTESISVGNTASSIEVTITSEAPWTATTSSSWIEVPTESGSAGTSTLTIYVSANSSIYDRTGYVVLYVGNTERIQIPIVQKGIYITTDKQSLSFKASGESQSFVIRSNTSWIVKDCPSWVTIFPEEGKGDATLVITATDNRSTNSRSASINITQEGMNIANIVTLEQKGKEFSVSTQQLSYECETSSQSFSIIAEDAWVVTNNNDWLSISSASGNGNATIVVSVSENDSESIRQGEFNITMCDKTISVSVLQKGKVFSLSTDTTTLSFPASGGESTLAISCNTRWSLVNIPSWIKANKEQGTGNADVVFTAEENPSVSERSADALLRIADKDDNAVFIQFMQYGKTFSISPSSLSFSDKGGTQNIVIDTDGNWTASTSNEWISISPNKGSGNTSLSVSVSENTSDSERNGSVSVSMGGKTLNISVSQKGKYLTIDNSLLTYTSKGGDIEVTITSNDLWKVYTENDESWITLSQTSGSGNVNIKVTAADNPSINKRSATIIVETVNKQSVRIVVTQDARYLTISSNSLKFYAKGGTSEVITVTTDGVYDIKCSDTWFSVVQTGNTFTVTATENNGGPRTGTITISLTDLKEGTYSLTITVIQLNNGGSFLYDEYGEDVNYDKLGNVYSITLSINRYGLDNNYDSSNKSGTNLEKKGYNSEKDYDSINNKESGANPTINGYEDDKNYDNISQNGIDLGLSGYQTDKCYDSENGKEDFNPSVIGYEDDKNFDTTTTTGISLTITVYQIDICYDTTISTGITITVTGYNPDKSYDSSNSSSGNVSIESYGIDTNHDSSNSSVGNITRKGFGSDNDWDN